MVFPIKRNSIEQVEPEFRAMEADPEVREAFTAWADSREKFNAELTRPGSQAHAQKWQKDYFRGSTRFGVPPLDHRTKLTVKEFANGSRNRDDS
jgi:hypothetical protein